MKKTVRLYLTALAMVCLIMGSGEARGQYPVDTGTLQDALNGRLTDARAALQSREFQIAIPALREGLTVAKENNDKEWEARFHFQLGVALQQRSFNASSTEDLTEAAGHYESFLKLRPRTGSALNNLAQIYTSMGRNDDAGKLFAQAVALEDDMMGFYAFNYAELLKKEKNWNEAADYYKKALESNPDHPESREGLLEAYQRIDQARLITFIWDQIDEGRDVWATTSALQALSNLPAEAASYQVQKQKEELLSCIAVGMSHARYGPPSKEKKGGTEMEVFQMLEKLTDDSDVGAGVKELLAVYEAPLPPENAATSWWADKGDRNTDAPEGWWPRDGFRKVLLSIGNWYERRNNTDTAEAYYLHAIHLTDESDGEPDLQAIVQLADLYLASNKMEEIENLLENTSTDLFIGKGEAYNKSKFKRIYTYHRTLGIMYALTEKWGDAATVTSAIFQLEHALDTREIFNEQIARRHNAEEIPVESRLVNLLAKAYHANDRSKTATSLQLRYLNDAVEAKDRFTSREILREIDYSTLEGQQARRYEQLRRAAGNL